MRLVYLDAYATDEEIVQSTINILEWCAERLKTEMYHKWPVKNVRIIIEQDIRTRTHKMTIMAEWKEPVQ